jgi:hypothetical protein
MISAQVQRTLVKSPPELWAELSDPASLARHLGELGEIRITRVEPEHKVEWAAEHASGSVQIKPSAWGTRVTLTASRERSPDPPTPLLAPPSPPEQLQPAAPPEITAPPPPGSVEPPLEAPPAVAATAATQRRASAPPLTSASGPPLASEHTPATATHAGRPAAAEPAPAIAGARGSEDHGECSQTPAEPAGESPTEAPSAAEPVIGEDALEGGSRHPEPSGQSRRGLLARLLRKLRREEPASAPERATARGEEPPAATPEPPPAAEPAAARLQEQPPEPRSGAHEQHLEGTAAPASERFEPPSPDPPTALAARAPQAAPPTATSAPTPPARPEGPGAPPPARSEAADDVTAVLTAVLDRLGAAHHRPFSRP